MDRLTSGTIEQIEGVRWADPGPDATSLIRRCLALRRKRLSQFTTEDLRIMLGQHIAVPILLPIAVTVLADNPLAEGDYYPGDLLYAVLQLPEPAWQNAAHNRERLVELLRATPPPDQSVHADLRRAIAAFIDSSPRPRPGGRRRRRVH
ncbi:MAG: hypothetical protein J2P57_04755 [Acidimicrobiaceae bacterium]|nr:hypothetical protein [Acidimicrobiaceae bacterium]